MNKSEEKSVIVNNEKIEVEFDSLNLVNRNIENISDIIGLESLSDLKSLFLANNKIKVISDMGHLIHLEKLDLSRNKIEEIQGLEPLINLRELDISQNMIQRIKGLESLVRLKNLNLSYNNIKEIEGLNKLIALESLQLFYNEITQIQNIENLVNLKELFLDYNRISAISNLNNLIKLETLGLSQNRISKVENLNSLIFLTRLYLALNLISKIEGLENNRKLKSLHLYMNNISKIEGLESLTDLEELTLFDNNIKKIVNLSSLKKLRSLDLMNNSISEMRGLGDLENLRELNLTSNQISEIRSLENLKELKHLYLADNFIVGIKGLETLDVLETLNMNYNEISDMGGLKSLKRLKRLDLSNNNIAEIKNLEELEFLEELYLRNNTLKSVRGIPIKDIPRYTSILSLDLRENFIEDSRDFLQLQNINLLKIDLYKLKYLDGVDMNSINRFLDKMIEQYLYFYNYTKERKEAMYDEVKKEELDDVLMRYNMKQIFGIGNKEIEKIQQKLLNYIDQRIYIEKTEKKFIYIGLRNLVSSLTKKELLEKLNLLLEAKQNFIKSGSKELINKYKFTLQLISLVFSSIEKNKFDLSNLAFDLINSNYDFKDIRTEKLTKLSHGEFINPIVSQLICYAIEENRTYHLDQKSPEKIKEFLKGKPPRIKTLLENLVVEEISVGIEHDISKHSTLKIYFAQMNLRKGFYDLNTAEFYPNEIEQIIQQIKDQLEKAKTYGSNFIIFPEYSFPKRVNNDLIQFSRENKIWIVGGCERFESSEFQCNLTENIALIIPPNNSPIIQKKRLKGKSEPPLTPGNDVKIIHSEFGSFSVLICADFLDDYFLLLLKEKLDFILVPSFNRDVELFKRNGVSMCVKNCSFIFVNNVIQYPNSSIYAPFKDISKEVQMQSIPFYEINFTEFSQHRKGKLSKIFKPPLSRTLYDLRPN
ncbi:MAG: leucine-rich repeat domain-containing protein [Candidatus Thorarchaeota archaeon]